MKKVLFALLLFATVANAQNWSPIVTGNKYHYTCDTTQTIFTLFADSFDVQGNDTLFYMNRIVLPCDTCVNLSWYQSSGPVEKVFLRNQPQFLLRNCLVSDTSIWCHSPTGFVLYPMRSVSSSWLFDTLNNITATVSEKLMGSVLGNTDSICVILLSTGDSVELSKNYGVVKFPVNGGGYFRLYGIEGNASIGERLAGFMDFFNFNVGDSFVYRVCRLDPEPPMNPDKTWFYSIAGKTTHANGFVYDINGEYCINVWACVNTTPFSGQLCFKDSCLYSMLPAFMYGLDYEINKEYYTSYSYQELDVWLDIYYIKRKCINDTDYVEFDPHSMHELYPWSPVYHDDVLTTDTIPIDSTSSSWTNYPVNYFKAREGVGIVRQYFCTFENSYLMEILYCEINGVILYDHLVNLESISLIEESPFIFPNPAQNNVTFTNRLLYNSANIYSTSGKKVKELILSGEQTEADVSELNPGMYFVIFEGKGKRATLKFVVESGN